jgi:UDP-N-acetylglucosamine 2-epimerase (non-hydrolysing)
VDDELGGLERVHLIEPMDYEPFINLISRSYLVLSDSGGIQEEAPSLGKPVLVLRNTTERPEAVDAGTVRLIGTGREAVALETRRLLDNEAFYERMANAVNPYGDGQASERIVRAIRFKFGFSGERPGEFTPGGNLVKSGSGQ